MRQNEKNRFKAEKLTQLECASDRQDSQMLQTQ